MGIMRTKNIDLPEKRAGPPDTHADMGKANRRKLGPSIEDRPKHIQDRTEFGHWEIDTVLGVKGEDDVALLTLVEASDPDLNISLKSSARMQLLSLRPWRLRPAQG